MNQNALDRIMRANRAKYVNYYMIVRCKVETFLNMSYNRNIKKKELTQLLTETSKFKKNSTTLKGGRFIFNLWIKYKR